MRVLLFYFWIQRKKLLFIPPTAWYAVCKDTRGGIRMNPNDYRAYFTKELMMARMPSARWMKS